MAIEKNGCVQMSKSDYPEYELVLGGFPGSTSRGALGWSSVTLINANNTKVLFDTGSPGDRRGVIDGLLKLGVEASEVDVVVLSHLHFDHASNLDVFPNADVVLHEEELHYAVTEQRTDLGLVPWLTAGVASSHLHLVGDEIEIAPNVYLIGTPGHTGGHSSLLFDYDGTSVILAGDAIKDRMDAIRLLPDGAFESAAASVSISRILDMADLVVPGHDCPFHVGADGSVAPVEPHPAPPLVEKFPEGCRP